MCQMVRLFATLLPKPRNYLTRWRKRRGRELLPTAGGVASSRAARMAREASSVVFERERKAKGEPFAMAAAEPSAQTSKRACETDSRDTVCAAEPRRTELSENNGGPWRGRGPSGFDDRFERRSVRCLAP